MPHHVNQKTAETLSSYFRVRIEFRSLEITRKNRITSKSNNQNSPFFTSHLSDQHYLAKGRQHHFAQVERCWRPASWFRNIIFRIPLTATCDYGTFKPASEQFVNRRCSPLRNQIVIEEKLQNTLLPRTAEKLLCREDQEHPDTAATSGAASATFPDASSGLAPASAPWRAGGAAGGRAGSPML